MKFKSGFITIIGRPNVGKSTLLNHIIGEKISIISDKPQTTRNKIQTIYTTENSQMVFVDTPGIHKPKNKLGEFMNKEVSLALEDMDVLVWLVDESLEIGPGDSRILKSLDNIKTPKILVINKIDKLTKDQVNKIINKYEEKHDFANIVPISAKNGKNVDELLKKIEYILPEGPKYFPEDMITDQPERLIVSEIIREKTLYYLDQEVPHGIAVETTMMKDRPEKELIDIHATIYCEKSSHKGIIIGKGGRKLKGIGKSARKDIERFLGIKVNLQLWVKVNKNWREKENLVKRMGYKK
ncbi:GTPase Era [Clostridium sp. D2Q-14]|uniref:GTPase Era n=1 Tax=Anaeromonas gelatinilytica TaxID=2683194 RepID=UPI00193C4D5A|nr:GTPase Era [Anaeromonas gelatinilytica]MBS4535280.1 GTPase Era [Anaeromonas gelatinilytica]